MENHDDTRAVVNNYGNGFVSLLAPTVRSFTSSELLKALWEPSKSILSIKTQSRSHSDESGAPKTTSGPPAPTTELDIRLAQLLEENGSGLSYGDQRAISKQIITSADEIAETIRLERIRQARTSFNAALILTIFGVLLIFAGALLVIAGIVAGGVLTSIASTIPQGMAVLLFRLSKQANDRLDRVNGDLARISRFRLTMELVDNISDERSRDRVIAQALRSLNSR